MATSMVYSTMSSSQLNPTTMKAAGYVDIGWYSGQGSTPAPPTSWTSACHSAGVGAVIQNSDSGSGGCGGSCDSYYASLAAGGVDAVGGESESGAEMDSIMTALIFYNYGGEGTGGPTGNNNVWAKTGGNAGAVVGKYGCSTWMETYTTDSMLPASEMGTEAGYNKDAGCFEVGLIVGSWALGDYGADASTYAEMADEMASQGVQCAGFHYWMWDNQSGIAAMTDLMAEYPPNMTPIYDRVKGNPGPGPGPGPNQQKGTIFEGFASQIDIAPYMQLAHNDQATRGSHYVDIYPLDSASVEDIRNGLSIRERKKRHEERVKRGVADTTTYTFEIQIRPREYQSGVR